MKSIWYNNSKSFLKKKFNNGFELPIKTIARSNPFFGLENGKIIEKKKVGRFGLIEK